MFKAFDKDVDIIYDPSNILMPVNGMILSHDVCIWIRN